MTDLLDTVNRNLDLLFPPFRTVVDMALDECHAKGLKAYVFEGYRSWARQNWLYRQGRSRDGKIVTKAQGGQSWHQYGLAVDVVFKDDAGQWTWSGDYAAVAEVMKKYGLEWYGEPTADFHELPHFQWKSAMKIYTAQTMITTGQSILDVWSLVELTTPK